MGFFLRVVFVRCGIVYVGLSCFCLIGFDCSVVLG